jgi:allose kinase
VSVAPAHDPARRSRGETVVIDMGGTYTRLGHLAGRRPAGMRATLETEALRSSARPLQWLAERVEAYAEEQALSPDRLIIGVPFTPDPQRTTALSSPNIRNLEGAPIRDALAERLGLQVTLERDINLLLLGERQAGAARGSDDIFGMFVGTGIGGAFLQGGQLFRGATGAAVELGHIPIRAEGARCVCGNTDCLEAYACGHTLTALAADEGVEVAEVFGPSDNRSLLLRRHAIVRDLAYGLATAINLFQPQLALVGGGVPFMAGFPRDRFETTFFEHLRRPVPQQSVQLRWAELGSQAALWGALALRDQEGS